MRARSGLVAVVLVSVGCGVGRAGAELLLQPGMPAVAQGLAPPLWQTPSDADRVPAGLSLEPPAPYQWLVEPGDVFRATVVVTQGSAASALLTVWDWERRPVAQVPLSCPAREVVSLRTQGAGVWLLTLDALQGTECTARLARSFGACSSNADLREQWRAGEFLVGACSFPGRQHWTTDYGLGHPPGLSEQASREMDADLCVRLGLQVMRPDLPVWWGDEGQTPDFTRADECMETLASRGFTLDLQLWAPGGGDWAVQPQYASVTDPKWRYPVRESVLRRTVAECVARYGEHAEFFELGNEPDNHDFWRGTPQEYLDFCRWASEEVRARVPGASIANGGFTFILPRWTGLFARALCDSTNLVAYHSHGSVDSARQTFGALQATLAAAERDDAACVNTEMGYAAWRLDAEMPMAASAVQKLLFCWAHGHKAALLYCSRDITGPRMTAGDWGMVDYFMCPRFVYGAVAAFIRHYAGARVESVLREDDRLLAYVFRRGDDRLVALCTPTESGRQVVIEHDAAAVERLDAMGNREECLAEGRTTVQAGYYPTTLVLRNATTVSLGTVD